MYLSEVMIGQKVEIRKIPDKNIMAQSIRLGVFEGAIFKCTSKIKHGPVILQNNFQEIAIGYNLAKVIEAIIWEG